MEFEDEGWFPSSLRDLLTDYLSFSFTKLPIYDPVVAHVQRLVESSENGKVVDLCSGGSGPWPRILRRLPADCPISLTLTDIYPNVERFERVRVEAGRRIDYRTEPIDARSVPADLSGARTLFAGFHHLRPRDARAVLADAANNRCPIGIFEFTDRSVVNVVATLVAPLLPLVSVPFIRPWSGKRILWGLVLPVVPLVVAWDFLASTMRSYRADEMLEMAPRDMEEEYSFEAGEIRSLFGLVKLTYLLGLPRAKDEKPGSCDRSDGAQPADPRRSGRYPVAS